MISPGEIVQPECVAYRVEGRQLQREGELDQALAAYQKAILVKPDYAEAYNDLGVVLESLGRKEDAEEAYKNALRFKPAYGPAHSNLAALYEESERIKEAGEEWAARVRLGPPDAPWVVKAREKLTQYKLPVPQTAEQEAQEKARAIRLAIETGRAHREAKEWDKAITQFEQALKLDPFNEEAKRLRHSAQIQQQQDLGRQARQMEAAKGRVKNEAKELRRRELARKAEAERERVQAKSNAGKERLVAKQMKELEQARRKAEAAERRAQKAEQEKMAEAAKRIEAEKRVEEIQKQAEADQKSEAAERAKRQLEESQRRADEAAKRAEIARKAAEAARMAAEAANQTYEAARQTLEAAKQTEAVVKQSEPNKPQLFSPPSDARAIAQEIARERAQTRGRMLKELTQRAADSMRDGQYQDAAGVYKQMLLLDPGNQNAKQGLNRAQKALAKASE